MATHRTRPSLAGIHRRHTRGATRRRQPAAAKHRHSGRTPRRSGERTTRVRRALSVARARSVTPAHNQTLHEIRPIQTALRPPVRSGGHHRSGGRRFRRETAAGGQRAERSTRRPPDVPPDAHCVPERTSSHAEPTFAPRGGTKLALHCEHNTAESHAGSRSLLARTGLSRGSTPGHRAERRVHCARPRRPTHTQSHPGRASRPPCSRASLSLASHPDTTSAVRGPAVANSKFNPGPSSPARGRPGSVRAGQPPHRGGDRNESPTPAREGLSRLCPASPSQSRRPAGPACRPHVLASRSHPGRAFKHWPGSGSRVGRRRPSSGTDVWLLCGRPRGRPVGSRRGCSWLGQCFVQTRPSVSARPDRARRQFNDVPGSTFDPQTPLSAQSGKPS